MCLRGFLRDVRVRAGLEQQGIMSLGTVVRAGIVCTVAAGTLGPMDLRGLLFDTLIVRAFMTPSIAALLGRWFWWPVRVRQRPVPQKFGADSRQMTLF